MSFHPDTPDEKRGFFCPDKEIKGLCGDVLLYVAQTKPLIDAARAEKDRFRLETGED
ncbi:MAG: hypothetical protein AB9919_05735 [Geobacteraceae bacterium]